MMASDCVRTCPPSSSAGTQALGIDRFVFRFEVLRLRPAHDRGLVLEAFQFIAMRTRNEAEDRKNV